MATPILHVKEGSTLKDKIQRAAIGFVMGLGFSLFYSYQWYGMFSFSIESIILIIVPSLVGFFIYRGRNYYLCEEGVGFPGIGGRFYQWAEFKEFTIDNRKCQFKLKMSKGSIPLTTLNYFNEAKEILLKHIAPKQ